ncbi:molybdopterin-dependent oxidoreductase [Leeia sp. TBRC 13508]|uniref:Molybdopterin-dependent oxidoreductase n=1 Tax=Leeia speluncae TaxID=2884804 RepID=A0ABS8D1Z0_9NEIS|nr:nitrate reductase [Leeia speluncae]MCB6182207.1 molybdopterin-dependent oxidoreductase [Leeia speluncae]
MNQRTEFETRSTCCYCGVGCGMVIRSDGEKIISVEGDASHPANLGRLCTKGRTLPLTMANDGRALYPALRASRDEARQRVSWDVALDTAVNRFADIIEAHGPDSVAFYLSGQLLTEDYYVFNKLAKGLIGTANIDTNSRLCMSSAVMGYKKAFGADAPPGNYEDLELADLLIIAGSNMAYAHPVLFRRIEAAKQAHPEKRWIVIDPRRTDTAAMADLHLAINPGTDVALFNGMLHLLLWDGYADRRYIDASTTGFDDVKALVRDYTPKLVADICGIAEQDLILAAKWFGESKNVTSLYCMGLNQSVQGTDKNLALINLHLATAQIGRPGAGPFSLTGQPNAMGGREVGGMATMLAAHRDLQNPEHRAEMAKFWASDVIPSQPGLSAVGLFDAVKSGKVKAVWIACTNPVHSMPDQQLVEAALKNAEFVVLQEAFTTTDTAPFADLLLPATSWGEKEGSVTNSERRISRVRPAIAAPGETKGDWWIATQFAKRLEARLSPLSTGRFEYENTEAIFAEHCLTTEGRDLDISGLSYEILEAKGPQLWPFPKGATEGLARRYTDGQFETADGKAKFHAVRHLGTADKTSARFPFHLLTGRLRDQWHGMSRTGRVSQLLEHVASAAVSMNPSDMERRGIKAGQLLKVSNTRGAILLPVEASDELASGSIFIPMHWNTRFWSEAGVNRLTTAKVDPISFQPELKHAAVRVEVVDLPWQCVAARMGPTEIYLDNLGPLLKKVKFATVTLIGRETPAVLVQFADEKAPEGFIEALDAALSLEASEATQDYVDQAKQIYKRGRWENSQLTGFRLAGETKAAGWLGECVKQGGGWSWPRLQAFAPRATPPNGALTVSKTICNCVGVTDTAIKAAIEGGADFQTLQKELKCGTQCGSCVPEIKRMFLTQPATPVVV